MRESKHWTIAHLCYCLPHTPVSTRTLAPAATITKSSKNSSHLSMLDHIFLPLCLCGIYACLCAYMCGCTCKIGLTCTCVHAHVGDPHWQWISSSIPYSLPSALKQGLLLDPKLTVSTNTTRQPVLGIPCLCFQHRDYRWPLHTPNF